VTAFIVVAWVLAALVTLVALLLASSLRLELRVDGLRAAARLGWAGVGVRLDSDTRTVEVRWLGRRVAQRALRRSERTTGEEPSPRRRKWSSRRRRWRRRALPGPDAWRFYRGQLAYLVRRIRVERCAGAVHVASPDPAVTGMAYGVVTALLMPAAACCPRAALAVVPDFEASAPSGWLDLAVRLRLATLARIALHVGWHERSRAVLTRRARTGKEREDDGSA